MYRVLTDFRDLRDGGYAYKAGDEYPRAGAADERRVRVLSEATPGRGPLIEYVEEEKPKKAAKKAAE